jgi:hypothetical protein
MPRHEVGYFTSMRVRDPSVNVANLTGDAQMFVSIGTESGMGCLALLIYGNYVIPQCLIATPKSVALLSEMHDLPAACPYTAARPTSSRQRAPASR